MHYPRAHTLQHLKPAKCVITISHDTITTNHELASNVVLVIRENSHKYMMHKLQVHIPCSATGGYLEIVKQVSCSTPVNVTF